MAFSSIVRALGRSPLTTELNSKLNRQQICRLNGIPRLPKGLVASALAQTDRRNLLVVCATLEEAGRWAAQVEAMGWKTVHFYPTSEASPYEPFDPETEITWGQMQVIADLMQVRREDTGARSEEKDHNPSPLMAIVATQASLQPHLPPMEAFKPYCLTLNRGMELNLDTFSNKLATLGYERVPLVEMEGQWSRRGDIVDVFPVSSELPVRLEWFGDELEQIREFDPATQRSATASATLTRSVSGGPALDRIDHLVLTPTTFAPIVMSCLGGKAEQVKTYLSPEEQDQFDAGIPPEGSRRFLGLAFDQPASLLDYLPENTLIAIDEPDQCHAHSDRWLEHAEEHLLALSTQHSALPSIHRCFDDSLATAEAFKQLYLSELVEENNGLNLASRPVPATPHQFAKLAEILRQERDRGLSIWLTSAQPSRSVSLLQEHDCPAQFIPNPRP